MEPIGGDTHLLGHDMAKRTTSTKTTAAVAAETIEPKVTTSEPVVAGPTLKKREFIDRATERSGLKKKDVKPSIEAALAVLAEALEKGEELVLPPLGKIKIVRQKEMPNGKVLTARIRLNKASDAQDVENDDSALEEADD